MNDNILYSKKGNLTITEKKKLEKTGKTVIEVKELSDIKSSSFFDTQNIVYKNCYTCGEKIWISSQRLEALKRSGNTHYCSFGHAQYYKTNQK